MHASTRRFLGASAVVVTRVERDVNRLAAKGFELRAMWAGTSMVNTLLSRPESSTSGSRTYEIDAEPITVPSVSSSSGRLDSVQRRASAGL